MNVSGHFGSGVSDLNLDMLGAKVGVVGGKAHFPRLFSGANPDGASAANEREWIVSDKFGWAGEFESDGVVGEGADGVEFVGNAEDDAGSVGAICNECRVIG